MERTAPQVQSRHIVQVCQVTTPLFSRKKADLTKRVDRFGRMCDRLIDVNKMLLFHSKYSYNNPYPQSCLCPTTTIPSSEM
jgi:hypothetical protein